MHRRLNILISAYACSPGRGSEPGMGWNFVSELSKFHTIHVITEEHEFREAIESFLKTNERFRKITFHFVPIVKNDTLRAIWPPSYYWYYRKWQKKAYETALKLEAQHNFDLIHQLNMVGYREPGYLWKIDKPFVWGPIGGLENSPWHFLPSLGLRGFVFYFSRNIINLWQRNFSKRPRLAAKREKMALISATKNVARLAKELWSKEPFVIAEVGQLQDISHSRAGNRCLGEPLKIIWSGTHTPGKNLPLLLRALRMTSIDYELDVLGDGSMNKNWKSSARKMGIADNIKWYGWLTQDRALKIMKSGHVFVITSISDLTATVTLEALSLGLPIICLNHCGFSDVVNENSGIKIKVSNPKKAAYDLRIALERIYNDEGFRSKLSNGAKNRSTEYSWEAKIQMLNTIYNSLVTTVN
ncbi:glycosyltransferase [Ulvibacterium sp.]|uniref:glycosyltransferase n=1 Tax=Ulvibacterium sp. TaxID=2665914 RepID=UPI002627C50A|nr:glycosyltransferase [Ulvibacterium sp.]